LTDFFDLGIVVFNGLLVVANAGTNTLVTINPTGARVAETFCGKELT
jgi:hypothetical protein